MVVSCLVLAALYRAEQSSCQRVLPWARGGGSPFPFKRETTNGGTALRAFFSPGAGMNDMIRAVTVKERLAQNEARSHLILLHEFSRVPPVPLLV